MMRAPASTTAPLIRSSASDRPRIAPGAATSWAGSRFMPTETKNTPSNRPLNGSIVASIARRYSVSARSSPATKAPSVIDRPLPAATSAVATMTRRQAAMNSSGERVRATSWNSGRSAKRPATTITTRAIAA
ncbi:hypothetical protein CHKEEEPN_0263 [Methylorubrum podarium]|nr:hypothetical protein CHKEEEPN_0263 [Methylorubrum podarium]